MLRKGPTLLAVPSNGSAPRGSNSLPVEELGSFQLGIAAASDPHRDRRLSGSSPFLARPNFAFYRVKQSFASGDQYQFHYTS
jgi:hypothetical protein